METFSLDLNDELVSVTAVRGALQKVAHAAAASSPTPGGDLDVALDELAYELWAALGSRNIRGVRRPTSAEEVRAALVAGPGVAID